MAPIAIEYTKDGSLGVSKTIKKEGSGKKPSMGDHLRVTYSGFLDDGRVITHSGLMGGQETIRLGMRAMWGTGGDLGLLSMTEGEHALIMCEKEFAGPDVANTKITLEVRLHRIMNADEAANREMRMILGGVCAFFFMVLMVLFMKGFHLFGW